MVDRLLLAKALADIRDAVARSREVVVLNLFVALQHGLSLATHWLADAGLDVPNGYSGFLNGSDRVGR